ncbi:hypothetical protein SUDANB174_00958 [Streptomyces sp. enrichment culture]
MIQAHPDPRYAFVADEEMALAAHVDEAPRYCP